MTARGNSAGACFHFYRGLDGHSPQPTRSPLPLCQNVMGAALSSLPVHSWRFCVNQASIMYEVIFAIDHSKSKMISVNHDLLQLELRPPQATTSSKRFQSKYDRLQLITVDYY